MRPTASRATPGSKRPAQRAIQFIINSQDPVGGGWRYTPGQLGDTSVFGWQMFALRSAHLAGIKIPPKILKACSRYLDQAGDQKRVTYAYQPGRPPTPAMTAEALLSRQLLGWPRDFPALVKGVGQISARPPVIGRAEHLLLVLRDPAPAQHEERTVGALEPQDPRRIDRHAGQGRGLRAGKLGPGHARCPIVWAQRAGRLYLTSLSILTLEVYYRYLPLYRSYDEDQTKPDAAMKPDAEPEDAAIKPDGRCQMRTRRSLIAPGGITGCGVELPERDRLVEDELRDSQPPAD